MKKVFLVFSLVFSLLLVGCNANKEEIQGNNNSGETVNNQQQVVTENDTNDYKLMDGYVLKEGNYQDMLSLAPSGEAEYTSKFTSDDTDYTLRVETTNNTKKMFLNDEELTGIDGELVGVFDFDFQDGYEEVVFNTPGSYTHTLSVYRVKKDNQLELLKEFTNLSLIKVGEKYIFPNYIDFIEEKVPYGYYEFNNGSFVYVDRFLNGEKQADMSDAFKNEVFTTNWTEAHAAGPGNFLIYENDAVTEKYLSNGCKIKILDLKLNSNNNMDSTDIELISDGTISEGKIDSENVKETPVKSGTKLTLKFIFG